MPATPPSATAASDQFLGHPKGLYVCFLTEMWERFAFYGMKALLLLYLIKHHLFSDTDGYLLLGTYAGLAYALPLLGGLLADRYLGMRKAVIFGGSLLVLGQLGMAWTGHAATETVVMQGLIEPADVAAAVIAGLRDERFLILPHPEVAEYYRRRASDPDRWLAGMQRLQARILGAIDPG